MLFYKQWLSRDHCHILHLDSVLSETVLNWEASWSSTQPHARENRSMPTTCPSLIYQHVKMLQKHFFSTTASSDLLSQVWGVTGSSVKSTGWQPYTGIYMFFHNHTKHHCLTSQSWPACFHGNKQSSVQSYRYWSPSCGLEIADFQHTEHKLFVSHLCSYSYNLSSIPSELQSLSMLVQGDGSLLSQ